MAWTAFGIFNDLALWHEQFNPSGAQIVPGPHFIRHTVRVLSGTWILIKIAFLLYPYTHQKNRNLGPTLFFFIEPPLFRQRGHNYMRCLETADRSCAQYCLGTWTYEPVKPPFITFFWETWRFFFRMSGAVCWAPLHVSLLAHAHNALLSALLLFPFHGDGREKKAVVYCFFFFMGKLSSWRNWANDLHDFEKLHRAAAPGQNGSTLVSPICGNGCPDSLLRFCSNNHVSIHFLMRLKTLL